jgi:hypothetical protein
MTEQELSQSHWWWRRTRFLFPRNHFDPNSHEWRQWKDGLEQTAFEYELVRQICKTRQLPPFTEIDGWIQHNLQCRFCPNRLKFSRSDVAAVAIQWSHQPGKKPEPVISAEVKDFRGLSDADDDGWRFNLEATDHQLLEHLRISKLPKASEIDDYGTGKLDDKQFDEIIQARKVALPTKSEFLEEINRQRAAQGIKPPRGLQGQRNRSVSWRWIELLDITAFKIKKKFKSTDSERQTKKRARTLARKLLPKYLEALDYFENSPRRPKEKVRPLPLLAREF